jgi:peptidoglycan/LPS O-acetylase OafA/YrhL
MMLDRLFRESARLPRIAELDGLRALLAWWVVLYHASGNTFSSAWRIAWGPLAWLSHGSLAVTAFMILSGFVIFFLLDREHEGYGPFITRRFFRLYPVYALCFAVMLGLNGLYVANLQANAAHMPAEQLASMLYDAEQPERDLPVQLALHAVMAHGAVPAAWLHNAGGAFLMPAWSISLEWQFYLIAPLVFWLIRRGGTRGAAVWLAVSVAVFATRGLWPHFSFDAFLPLQLHSFTVGIASYYVWKAVALGGVKSRLLAAAPLAVAVAVAALVAVQCVRLGVQRGTTPGLWLPFAIWAFAFAALLAGAVGDAGPLARATRRVLAWPPLERLGVVSYSTYLVHWPVLVLCQAAYRTILDAPSPWTLFALHVAVSFPLVAAVSFALYRFVEAPGMTLGRRLAGARRLSTRLRISTGDRGAAHRLALLVEHVDLFEARPVAPDALLVARRLEEHGARVAEVVLQRRLAVGAGRIRDDAARLHVLRRVPDLREVLVEDVAEHARVGARRVLHALAMRAARDDVAVVLHHGREVRPRAVRDRLLRARAEHFEVARVAVGPVVEVAPEGRELLDAEVCAELPRLLHLLEVVLEHDVLDLDHRVLLAELLAHLRHALEVLDHAPDVPADARALVLLLREAVDADGQVREAALDEAADAIVLEPEAEVARDVDLQARIGRDAAHPVEVRVHHRVAEVVERHRRGLVLDLVDDPRVLLDGHLVLGLEDLLLERRIAVRIGVHAGGAAQVAERRDVDLHDRGIRAHLLALQGEVLGRGDQVPRLAQIHPTEQPGTAPGDGGDQHLGIQRALSSFGRTPQTARRIG